MNLQEFNPEKDFDASDEEEKPKRAGRRKIKIEYIHEKSRRHITFSKRKSGIMKKAYELSTLTGTQVLLLVASETGHVYTFATAKLQPIITQQEGKNMIQACLNAQDRPESVPPPPNRPFSTPAHQSHDLYEDEYYQMQNQLQSQMFNPMDGRQSPFAHPMDGRQSPFVENPMDGRQSPFIENPMDGRQSPFIENPMDGRQSPFIENPMIGRQSPFVENHMDGRQSPFDAHPMMFDGRQSPFVEGSMMYDGRQGFSENAQRVASPGIPMRAASPFQHPVGRGSKIEE